MGPVMAAALPGLIAAGGQVLGGLVGSRGAGRSAKSAKRSAILNYNLQRNFAQHGIRWRVEDAKRAGLHPLYALGGAGAAYTPQSTAVDFGEYYSQLGQGLSRAAQAGAAVFEREEHAAQLENLKSQTAKNQAETLYWASEAARNRQSANATKGIVETFPLDTPRELKVRDMQYFSDSGVVEPQTVLSRSSTHPYQQPFVNPGLTAWDFTFGQLVLPQANSASEALESMAESPLIMVAVYNENVARFGRDEAQRRLKALLLGGDFDERVRAGSAHFRQDMAGKRDRIFRMFKNIFSQGD